MSINIGQYLKKVHEVIDVFSTLTPTHTYRCCLCNFLVKNPEEKIMKNSIYLEKHKKNNTSALLMII